MNASPDFFGLLDEGEQDFFSGLEEPVESKQVPLKRSTEAKQDFFSEIPDFFEGIEAEEKAVQETPKQRSLMDSFKQGLRESTSGEIQRLAFNSKDLQDEIANDPTFWASLARSSGEIVGDIPYVVAGGSLGASLGASLGSPGGVIGSAVGGVAGGAFGSLAMPAFLKQALKEFRDYRAKGNDIDFEEFLSKADRVASKTLKEGAFGVILGSINKAMPLLKETPGLGKLFTTKAAQKAGAIGAETAAIATLPAVTEGRLPESKDYAHALALVLGFNVAHLPREIRERIQKAGEASGVSPEEFAREIPREEMSEISRQINQAEQTSPLAEAERNVFEARQKMMSLPERGDARWDPVEEYEASRNLEQAMDVQQKLLSREAPIENRSENKRGGAAKIISAKAKLLAEETPKIPEGAVLSKPENISIGIRGGKASATVSVRKINAEGKEYFTHEEVGLTGEERELIDGSNQWEKAGDNAEASILAQEAREMIYQRLKGEPLESAKAEQLPKPITEVTGEGAAERIEYPKTGIDKIIAKTNEFIQAAKTPGASLKRLGQALNEGIFNSLAPLERLETELPVSEKVSTRIKQAQTATSEINSVLENGIFSNMTGNFEHEGLKGAYGDLTWKKFSKGLKEGEYSLQDLDTYRASKIALKRQNEGKKTGIDTKQAKQDIAKLAKKYAPIDKRIRDFQKATLKHYGKDLLGEELIEKWNKDYYAPLFRVMDSGKDSILKSGALTPKQPFKKMEGSERKIIPPSESDPYNASMLINNSRKNDSILQYRKLVLEGKLPGKIRPAKNEPIPKEILDDLDIDPSLNKVAESLYNQTRKEAFTPEKNVLRGWKDGKPFNIEVPEDIYNVFSTLTPQDRSPITQFISATNRLFSKGISMAPRKFGSIFGRDALSSLVYSRTGSNPISVTEALSDIYHSKPIYKEFRAMGGDIYASRLAERIDRAKKVEDLITPGKEGILVPFEKMAEYFSKYSKTLGDISLAVPLAEYKRALAKYGNTPEGRIMAAMEARRVTYDPTRKGSSKMVRELGNFIPFWNVSLQDMSMVGQNLKRPEAWIKGMTAITLPTLLLKMANEGNPDYEDLTPVDKAAFWHVYFGDKHVRVPIPWLLGTTFKVGAEAFYDTAQDLYSKGDPRAKEAWNGLYHNFVENLSGSLPPILSNYIEMSTGKSVPSPLGLVLGTESRAPEVVPRRLQGLPPKFQYTNKTSQLARKFGQLWDVSPVKLERTIKNFGTQVAADILALTDEIAYATGLAEDKRPEQRESNYLLLGNFVSHSTPSRTKYMNEFYEYFREAEQHKKAQKLIREQGLEESLDEIKYRNVALGKFQRDISKLFKAMRTTEDSTSLSASEKKTKLNELQGKINHLYKTAVEKVRESKQ